MPYNTESKRPAYKSKYSTNHKNQEILLMIAMEENCTILLWKVNQHYLEGQNQNMYRTENNVKKYEKVCDNDDYCYVEIPSEDNDVVKHNPGEKSMKET